MNEIENSLTEARRRAGMSRQDVALRIRVTPERVTRWETGDEKPCTETLFELSALYNVPPHRLLLAFGEATRGKTQPASSAPTLDAFRRELIAMRDVELLPLDDETIDYCVGALRAKLAPEKSPNE